MPVAETLIKADRVAVLSKLTARKKEVESPFHRMVNLAKLNHAGIRATLADVLKAVAVLSEDRDVVFNDSSCQNMLNKLSSRGEDVGECSVVWRRERTVWVASKGVHCYTFDGYGACVLLVRPIKQTKRNRPARGIAIRTQIKYKFLPPSEAAKPNATE